MTLLNCRVRVRRERLRLDEEHEGEVPGIGERPRVDGAEARLDRRARRAIVDDDRVEDRERRAVERVELEVPHALLGELHVEGRVLVVGRLVRDDRVSRPEVVAVVRPEHLHVLQSQLLVVGVRIGVAGGRGTRKRQGEQRAQEEGDRHRGSRQASAHAPLRSSTAPIPPGRSAAGPSRSPRLNQASGSPGERSRACGGLSASGISGVDTCCATIVTVTRS